jgi:integrase/recombinase XerD
LIGQYREHLARENYAPRTVEDYPQKLKAFMKFLSHDDAESLGDITPETISRYQSYLYGLKKRKTPASWSLNSQSVSLTVLRQFFRYLLDQDKIMNDPTRKLELPKLNKSLPKGVMTGQEIRRILAQPDADNPIGLRDKAILELLYSTGIRNSELRNLMVYDVDIPHQELRINQGKGRKDRVIPVGSIAAGYVEEYLQNARPLLAKRKEDPPYLFVSYRGKRITAANLIWAVNKYVEQAKIAKHITPHAFRHTCATHLLKRRASLRHIQELLGHKTISATQVYTQLETGDLKKELRRCHPREQAR